MGLLKWGVGLDGNIEWSDGVGYGGLPGNRHLVRLRRDLLVGSLPQGLFDALAGGSAGRFANALGLDLRMALRAGDDLDAGHRQDCGLETWNSCWKGD